jgi:hypothetical protein
LSLAPGNGFPASASPAMLDALEDYVKRQKKRLGLTPTKKEAAN